MIFYFGGVEVIVHICNNFVSSKVHFNLIKNICSLGAGKQKIFVPVRHRGFMSSNNFCREKFRVFYFYCPKFLRYFPLIKVLSVFFGFSRFFSSLGSRCSSSHVLAHTLWSDGVVAYLGSLVFGFSYSVVVRNTDVNVFMPMLPHYRWLIKLVIKNSNNLIFVNNAYKNRFIKYYPDIHGSAKSVTVIHNAIEDYWLENQVVPVGDRSKVCFVGSFNRNKNLSAIIESVRIARIINPSLRLVLIGGERQDLVDLVGYEPPEWIEIPGFLVDKNILAEYYRDSFLFLMPSIRETFGLVYLEALSQGCRLICSIGEGVDGIVPADFLTVVDPSDFESIGRAVNELYATQKNIDWCQVRIFLNQHSWKYVASEYIETLGVDSSKVL